MPEVRHLISVAASLLAACCAGVRAQSPADATAEFTMIGVVLDQNGEPVRAAEVWVTAAEAPDVVIRRTRTDGEGMFLLGRMDPTATVHAQAAGMTTATIDCTKLNRGTTLTAELRLWDARTLRGRVVDERGTPIAGASLIATKDGCVLPLVPVEGTTDVAGNFELTGVPIGDCVLRAAASGFVCDGHQFHDWIDERADLRLRRGDGVQLDMSVEGLDADAFAATAVHLRAVAQGSCRMPSALEWQRLDAVGTCSVKGLPMAEWVVSMHHPDYRFASAIRVLKCADPDPLRFLARRVEPAAVSGRVLANGQPAVSQTIRLHRGRQLTNRPLHAVTDGEGYFEFLQELHVGDDFLLELDDPGLTFEQPESTERFNRYDRGYLGLHGGTAPTVGVQLTAVPASSVRGRVLDAAGRAVSFAMIEVQCQARTFAPGLAKRAPRSAWVPVARTMSGADGTYILSGLQRGPWPVRLQAVTRGAIGATQEFPFGELNGTVDIRTEPPGRIEGCLLDEFGDARFGVEVVLDGEQYRRVLTDYRGSFVFPGLPPGTYQVTVQRDASLVAGDAIEVKSNEIVRVDPR